MIKWSIVLIVLVIVVLGIGIVGRWSSGFGLADGNDIGNADMTITSFDVDGESISVEIAQTRIERKRGLSRHDQLAEGAGMLFVFPDRGRHGIWMKDMDFAIDIIWLSESFEVVDVKKDVRPNSYPQVFRPSKPARYVLEVNGGVSERYNITPGARLIPQRTAATSTDRT